MKPTPAPRWWAKNVWALRISSLVVACLALVMIVVCEIANRHGLALVNSVVLGTAITVAYTEWVIFEP